MTSGPQRCPRCWASRVQLPLEPGRDGRFDLHACGQCGGVWLGPDAAGKVLADTEHGPSGLPPSLFCPCCNGGMTAVLVRPTGIVVDRCDADGVWFDARELDAICAAAAQRKGVRLPARAASEAGGIAMDVALTMPETVYFGAEAIGGAIVDASGDSSVAELAGDALVGASEAGSGVFETLGELLGALFD